MENVKYEDFEDIGELSKTGELICSGEILFEISELRLDDDGYYYHYVSISENAEDPAELQVAKYPTYTQCCEYITGLVNHF